MSMEHKAFLFDYDSFDRELRSILEDALGSGDSARLRSYIISNLHRLKDPYEGYALSGEWESLIESHNAHQYGDFALTKYYRPTSDIGLGRSWEHVQELIASDLTLTESPILGATVGPRGNPFDPGGMGSYFQSSPSVRQHLEYLSGLAKNVKDDGLLKAMQMLNEAAKVDSGLYITF